MPVDVLLYSRPDCHLCAEARARIGEIATERGWEIALREVDIDSDDELLRRYLERIPVVVVEGEIVSELVLDEMAFIQRIATVAADG